MKCINHIERESSGLCILCRKSLCEECITRIEGKNYCSDCLERMAREYEEWLKKETEEIEKKTSLADYIIFAGLFIVIICLLWIIQLLYLE